MTRSRVPLRIAADHPALAGHFPGQPIVPGVVLLDEVVQAIQAQRHLPTGAGWRIEVVKFHQVVLPDQPLQLDYEADSGGAFAFELHCAGSLAASGTLIPAPARTPA